MTTVDAWTQPCYVCPVCRRRFSTKNTVIRHVKAMHPCGRLECRGGRRGRQTVLPDQPGEVSPDRPMDQPDQPDRPAASTTSGDLEMEEAPPRGVKRQRRASLMARKRFKEAENYDIWDTANMF